MKWVYFNGGRFDWVCVWVLMLYCYVVWSWVRYWKLWGGVEEFILIGVWYDFDWWNMFLRNYVVCDDFCWNGLFMYGNVIC